MTNEFRGRALARRAGVGAISTAVVASLLLITNPSPANAATINVAQSDIAGNESTYAGWHQGYDNAALDAAITSGGLSLRGKSQIIKGYADNDNAGLADNGVNADLTTTLPGATYNVVAGSAFFQVPLFVDSDNADGTPGVFTTLRPADAATGAKTIASGDQWQSSKTFGSITENTSYPLSQILAEIDAHKYKTLAFGVLTYIDQSATVATIGWKGDTYNFVPAAISQTTVKDADVKDEETASNYADWHQGYANANARHQVVAAGLVLAGQSQVIKGFSNNSNTLNSVNANLQFVLPEASYTVAAGSAPVSFQVAVKYDNGDGVKFATLRNTSAGPGTHDFALTDQWQSSKTITEDVPANTDVALGDLIEALGNYKTIAFGVLTSPGTKALVQSITFGTKSYTFSDLPAAPSSTSLTKVRDIAPNENTYAGWHQGSAGGVAPTADLDSNVLKLGALKSQIIKGYADNSNDVDSRNVNLVDALTHATYTVAGGEIFFQVPLFLEDPVDGSTKFTTLRPATGATTGVHGVNVGQQWISSRAFGDFSANEPYLLGDLLSAIKTYKVLAFGVYTDPGANGSVTDITWDGVRNTFTGNRSPVAPNLTATTKAGTAVTIDLGPTTDVDGDAITYTAPNVNGTNVIVGDQLTFTPAAGRQGTTTITYTATDSLGAAKTGQIAVRVTKVTTTLTLSSAKVTGGDTVVAARPVAPGGVVTGAVVDVKRNNKLVGTAKVGADGVARVHVGNKLPAGKYIYVVYYRGTLTTTAVKKAITVNVS